jgi:CDP-diacylglycerol--serine O-phosphatidyltransferase
VTGSESAEGQTPRSLRRFRRGVSILASLFTTGNLFVGFLAMIRTIHEEYAQAGVLIIIAVVLDMLDGRIARLTGTASEFGGELDSLADAVSFGVAPALLVYKWGLTSLHPAGWLAAFLFVVGGVVRLARFNVQRHVVDSRHFVGLPIPAAAGQLSTVVMLWRQPLSDHIGPVILLAGTVVLSFLMVSTFRYPSFKGVDLRSRRSYVIVLGVALLFMLVALHPKWVLLGLATGYTISAPSLYFLGLLRRRRAHAPGQQAAVVSDETLRL